MNTGWQPKSKVWCTWVYSWGSGGWMDAMLDLSMCQVEMSVRGYGLWPCREILKMFGGKKSINLRSAEELWSVASEWLHWRGPETVQRSSWIYGPTTWRHQPSVKDRCRAEQLLEFWRVKLILVYGYVCSSVWKRRTNILASGSQSYKIQTMQATLALWGTL